MELTESANWQNACSMPRAMFWRNNSLSIVLGTLFVACMAGQALTGWFDFNTDSAQHGESAVGFIAYLASGHFWEATGENWESEFLQMAAFVLLTCFLRQKGSAESKRIDVVEDVDLDPGRFADQPDAPWPVRRGGWVLKLYEHSLGLTFILLFIVAIAMHAVGGLAEYNQEQTSHGQAARPARGYASVGSVLVRVLSELAERVPVARFDGRRDHPPAPAWFRGVQTRARAARRDREVRARPDPVERGSPF